MLDVRSVEHRIGLGGEQLDHLLGLSAVQEDVRGGAAGGMSAVWLGSHGALQLLRLAKFNACV